MGALIGVLAQRGRGRALVTAMLGAACVLGVAVAILGVIALAASQPPAVYAPLLLFGLLLTGLSVAGLRTVRERYEEIEFRRMQALDIR